MKVVKPTAITTAILGSTTATETVAAWVSGTTYAVSTPAAPVQVLRAGTVNRIYTCISAVSTAPNTTTAPESLPACWADAGPSNTWAMFDTEVSTTTNASGSLSVVINPGYVNSLCLFGLVGTTLTVSLKDAPGGTTVYSKTITLDGTVITDWYMYFFEPAVQLGDLVLTDLPPYSNAQITVTLTGTGTVKCGILAVGTFYNLGDTEFGATASIIDYSRKDTTAAGVTSFTKRAYSKRMSARAMLDNVQMNKVQRVLADVRATPCAWIGTDLAGYEPLTVFGFYRDFSIDIAYPTKSYCSLEIEGLT